MGRIKLSLATRRKISRAQSGKSNSMYGKHHTKAALAKISFHSRGRNNPMFGKTHTEQARRKISVARRRAHQLARLAKQKP